MSEVKIDIKETILKCFSDALERKGAPMAEMIFSLMKGVERDAFEEYERAKARYEKIVADKEKGIFMTEEILTGVLAKSRNASEDLEAQAARIKAALNESQLARLK